MLAVAVEVAQVEPFPEPVLTTNVPTTSVCERLWLAVLVAVCVLVERAVSVYEPLRKFSLRVIVADSLAVTWSVAEADRDCPWLPPMSWVEPSDALNVTVLVEVPLPISVRSWRPVTGLLITVLVWLWVATVVLAVLSEELPWRATSVSSHLDQVLPELAEPVMVERLVPLKVLVLLPVSRLPLVVLVPELVKFWLFEPPEVCVLRWLP